MTINLRYLATMAEATGVAEGSVNLSAGATVGDLRTALIAARGADFARQLVVSALLIGDAHANDTALLPSGAVRADVLPPLVGG